MAIYVYIPSRNQYKNTATGRYVSQEEVYGYVEAIIEGGSTQGSSLVDLLISNQISAADFGAFLKDELKYSYLQQSMLGKGGRDQMDFSDWGYLGQRLREEYAFINGFVEAIPELSEAQIRARAANYFKATRSAYERSRARSFGIPDLPAYPGDGSTLCINGCACSWDITRLDGDGNLDCTWSLGIADHCETCLARAGSWNPIEVRDGVVGSFMDIRI